MLILKLPLNRAGAKNLARYSGETHTHPPLQTLADHRIIRETPARYLFEGEGLGTELLRRMHIDTGGGSDGGSVKLEGQKRKHTRLMT